MRAREGSTEQMLEVLERESPRGSERGQEEVMKDRM